MSNMGSYGQPFMTEGNRRILVLDDNPAIQRDFKRILCGRRLAHPSLDHCESVLFQTAQNPVPEMAFCLTPALQGEEGVKLAEASISAGQPFALVFVDLRMPPGWDGITTVTRLWEVDPHLEIVICTGYSDFSWPEISQRLGRSDQVLILKKPCEPIEVVQLAHALTEKWNLAFESRRHTRELEERVAERTRLLEAQICERERIDRQRALEAERTRITRDLHDDLGSGLTEIGMLGDRAFSLAASPLQQAQYLEQIRDTSHRMVSALDEIVWAMNPGHDSLESFVSYSRVHAERFLRLARIACRLTGAEHIPEAGLESACRHELFLALKEALTNVVRHSGATEVHLGFAFELSNWRLILADNGRGLPDLESAPNGDGLANIKARLNKLGGELELLSDPKLGTTLQFVMPLSTPV
jgi:signal transduction histidine kinase